ncbi:MAG: VIT1/CCC1 transporter family protein [Candidatus Woesearchaeota archaeon]
MVKVTKEGDFIKDVIHGGLDGTITTFAIISGVTGAALGAPVILVIGSANLIAHGLAIAVSYYAGVEAENIYNINERKKETRYLLHHFTDTEKELEKYYMKHHYTQEDAEKIVHTLAKHKKVLTDTVIDEELHLDSHKESPTRTSFITFTAFLFFGFVPLFSYILEISPIPFALDSFIVAAGLTGATIFGLGTFRAAVTDRHWLQSGLEFLALGGIAATLAFVVGTAISHF